MGINLNNKYTIIVFCQEYRNNYTEFKHLGKIMGLLNNDIGIGMFNEINHHIYNNIDILDPSSFGIAKYEMISNDKNRWVFLYTKTEEVIDQLNDSTEYTEFIKNCKKIYMISPNNSSLWEKL